MKCFVEMQKLLLLQKSPPSPLVCTSVATSFLTSSCRTKPINKTPFHSLTIKPYTSLSMPTATVGGGGSSLAACVARKATVRPTLPSRFSSNCYSACRCATETTATKTPFRAWVVARPAWYCTVARSGAEGPVTAAAAAVEGLKSCDGDSEKGEKEEKKVRMNRRQKGSSEVVGNADLLTIPGVGPKNLRKLVEKGFCGMAELKKLYKDKVLVDIYV